jgi:radical SAM protein with 4Fe4S-binding SPASM domain
MNDILSKIRPLPRRCSWELTLECNLRCSHCGSSAGDGRHDELSTEEALSIADQLATLGCREVTLLGGEPFVRHDWHEIASRLISHGIETTFVSNGILVDDFVARRLFAIGVKTLGLSVDGLGPTHDRVRARDGVFRQVIEAFRTARRAGLSTCAVTVVLPDNIRELYPLAKLLESAGVEYWQLQLPVPRGRYQSETWLTAKTVKAVVDFISMIRERTSLRVYAGCNIGYLGQNEERVRTAKTEGLGFWTGCYAGVLLVAIRSNGDITGCLTMPPDFTEGNIREKNLYEIWTSGDAFVYNRRFDRSMLRGACASCEQADICRGGCRTMSYYITGLLHCDPCCELQANKQEGEVSQIEVIK